MKKMKTALTTICIITAFTPLHSYADTQQNTTTHAIESLSSYDAKITETYYKDLDQDGVQDQKDHCLNTSFGVPVDQTGCAIDADKDGVADHIDKCLNSSPGAVVNQFGCENDEDGDGVPDSKDECPGTPAGTPVNAKGCEIIDIDQDKVDDAEDECIDTPLGGTVNRHGCEPHEYVLTNIVFKSYSHQIEEDQKPIIRKDAAMLSNLKENEVVLITGHTDYQGRESMNIRLSWRRANSAKDFIVNELSHVQQLVYINGKGEMYPVADNTTEEGRQENRRIELNVIPRDALPADAKLILPPEMIKK